MSRIGNRKLAIPAGVTVSIENFQDSFLMNKETCPICLKEFESVRAKRVLSNHLKNVHGMDTDSPEYIEFLRDVYYPSINSRNGYCKTCGCKTKYDFHSRKFYDALLNGKSKNLTENNGSEKSLCGLGFWTPKRQKSR